MKKLLLMFAAVAAIAFVGCKTENAQPAEGEQTDSIEAQAPEYTVESVTTDLMKFVEAKDEAGTFNFLDGLKKTAEDLLNAKDENGYFNLMNIIQKVWEANKDKITELLPNVAAKMADYITIPDAMKPAFDKFVADAAQKAGEVVDATVDAAKEKAGEAVDAAKEKAGEAVDAAKDAAGDAAQKAADALKN